MYRKKKKKKPDNNYNNKANLWHYKTDSVAEAYVRSYITISLLIQIATH